MENSLKLDEKIIEDFRKVFYNDNLFEKLSKDKKWNNICAAMDAIQVGVAIINSIESKNRHHHFAIELIELITAGQMIKQGICELYNKTLNNNYPLKNDNSILKISNISDDKAFSEYRALSFAHVMDFKKTNEMANNQSVCFSWLHWEYHSSQERKGVALRYPDGAAITINFNDIFRYIQTRYNCLKIIEKEIITSKVYI